MVPAPVGGPSVGAAFHVREAQTGRAGDHIIAGHAGFRRSEPEFLLRISVDVAGPKCHNDEALMAWGRFSRASGKEDCMRREGKLAFAFKALRFAAHKNAFAAKQLAVASEAIAAASDELAKAENKD